jgi:hypothetical protein
MIIMAKLKPWFDIITSEASMDTLAKVGLGDYAPFRNA